MFNEITKSDAKEIKGNEKENFRNIKPESGMTVGVAREFLNSIFSAFQEKVDGYYTSYEDRINATPKEDSKLGSWTGQRGESNFIPNGENEKGKMALEKLSEKNLSSVKYENGEPDFSEVAEASVQIDNMTENRQDYDDGSENIQRGNFSQADMKCAENFNATAKDGKTDWTAADVRKWRRENDYTWHECCDLKTMQLVPSVIHEVCKHSGGVAECKARDKIGGGFDE